jgi:hypothetical protein
MKSTKCTFIDSICCWHPCNFTVLLFHCRLINQSTRWKLRCKSFTSLLCSFKEGSKRYCLLFQMVLYNHLSSIWSTTAQTQKMMCIYKLGYDSEGIYRNVLIPGPYSCLEWGSHRTWPFLNLAPPKWVCCVEDYNRLNRSV